MKFIPILFSTAMVQAIMQDCKTMTRRVIKEGSTASDWLESGLTPEFIAHEGNSRICPYGSMGDVLWVRETFSKSYNQNTDNWEPIYKAGGVWFDDDGPVKWKPSIFMPKAACRIFLKITNIRVERLKDISEADALAEGVVDYQDGTYKNYFKQKGLTEADGVECLAAEASFQSLWCSINGIDSWAANPFVWVVEFKRIEKPENFK